MLFDTDSTRTIVGAFLAAIAPRVTELALVEPQESAKAMLASKAPQTHRVIF